MRTAITPAMNDNAGTNHPVGERGLQTCWNLAGTRATARSPLAYAMVDIMLFKPQSQRLSQCTDAYRACYITGYL